MSKVSDKSTLTHAPIARIGDGVLVGARLLSRSITAIYDDKLRPFGVTAAQLVLLTMISRRPMTRADIARLQHLERSTLTRNLRAVLAEGWIEEVRENANGRSRPIALTAAGRQLLLETEPAWLAAEREATALLGTEGMMTIIGFADRLANLPDLPEPTEEPGHNLRHARDDASVNPTG